MSPAKKSVKTPASKPAGKLVTLPSTRGGKLWQGKATNHVAGPGRPPDAIRAAMRGKLDVALPKLWTEYEAGTLDALGFANFLAKYGLGSKELVIASTEAAAFFDCVYRATVEAVGEQQAESIKLRAVALMDSKA